MNREPIEAYGRKGGPLPTRNAGSISSAFWRAYELGPNQKGLRGGAKDSPAGIAFHAGLQRRKVEPDLETRQAASAR